MEEIKISLLLKIEKILDEELSTARIVDRIINWTESSNESSSEKSTKIDAEIQCGITSASTPIKNHVPIDLTLTPVKKEGLLYLI
jgi:hypothetical protein